MRSLNIIDLAVANDSFYALLVCVCLLLCSFFSLEGGLQLHLTHDHPAFGCVALAMSEGAKSPPPPCTSPDVSGEPWRLQLVGLDLLGFGAFGMFWTKLRSARKLAFAKSRATRDRASDL